MFTKSFYSPKELAAELEVGYRLILNETAAGRLNAYRLGGKGRGCRIRISARDAESWMEEHCRMCGKVTPKRDRAVVNLDDYRW